jgi:hypothetical protein
MLRSQCQTAAARFSDAARYKNWAGAGRFFEKSLTVVTINASKRSPDDRRTILRTGVGQRQLSSTPATARVYMPLLGDLEDTAHFQMPPAGELAI